ncbi:MAG: glycosyltransferase family 2 protein [Parcubacteria group bacterium]|nr:glycosyltransferase family 2 protein [Parcubacteria group bacterium]
MDLSIIIVSWKVKDLLKKCLNSIFEQTKGLEFEVIVIDNDSRDGTAEMVKRDFPAVNFVESKENLGFAKANNIGILKAKGRYTLLLNPDTEILDGALDKCVQYLDKHPEAGALGCKLLYPDGSLQESCRRFPAFWDQFFVLLKLHNFFPNWGPIGRYYMKDFKYDRVEEVDQIMGAFMLARREIFERIGYLDERFFAWFEEVDWCRRVKEAGMKIIFYPDAVVIHHKGQSFNQYFQRQWLFDKSLLYYFKKHRPKREYYTLWLLAPINIFLDRLAALLRFAGAPFKKIKNL